MSETFDRLLSLVPCHLHDRSGGVFYSGRSAFRGHRPLYLLGLNPGGDPVRQVEETVARSIRRATENETDDWSAYADESWRGRPAGTATLQPRVLHLLNNVGLEPRTVPASNVVFVRSGREADLTTEKAELLKACWPVHQAVIDSLGVKVVACMGATAGQWVREMLGAHQQVEQWTEENERRWSCSTHAAANGIQVVTLTHPSIAAWNSPAADPSRLVRNALERATDSEPFDDRNVDPASEATSRVTETTEDSQPSPSPSKRSVRARADAIKPFRCKHLIAVIEDPTEVRNIGTVIRNANALGVEKVYVVDTRRSLPDDWQELRSAKAMSKVSVSAVKWTFVKRFDSTDECFDHLEANGYKSIVTSPHVKGKASIYLDEGDFTAHPKLAVWFGSEAIGISDRAVERSEMCVSVPMFGMIESLNLGTSSGIVLYEVTKQRRAYQSRYRLRGKRGERTDPLPTVMPTAER